MRLAQAPAGAVFVDRQGNRWIRHDVGASLVVGATHLVPVGEDLIAQVEGDVDRGCVGVRDGQLRDRRDQ